MLVLEGGQLKCHSIEYRIMNTGQVKTFIKGWVLNMVLTSLCVSWCSLLQNKSQST